MHPHAHLVLRVAALALVGVPAVLAQTSKSAPLLKAFVDAAGGEMRYVAAKLPATDDEYVAALHIPGVQLLVVAARYEQPTLLDQMLSKRDYQGVYTDLNSASYAIAASRVFIEDLRADGLLPDRDDDAPFDVYEMAGKRYHFDGDFRKQKLSEKEYQEAFAAADTKYVQAIQVLTAELKKGS
jgi:hypothetical protein